MIRTIFIIQIICLAAAFLNVVITGANSFSELTMIGKLSCIVILIGFALEFGIVILSIFKKRN